MVSCHGHYAPPVSREYLKASMYMVACGKFDGEYMYSERACRNYIDKMVESCPAAMTLEGCIKKMSYSLELAEIARRHEK